MIYHFMFLPGEPVDLESPPRALIVQDIEAARVGWTKSACKFGPEEPIVIGNGTFWVHDNCTGCFHRIEAFEATTDDRIYAGPVGYWLPYMRVRLNLHGEAIGSLPWRG